MNVIAEDGTPNRRHRKHLSQLLNETSGTIRIATAYLTERQILAAVTDRETRLLTSLTALDVASGATSLESLNAILHMGVECRILPPRPRLHAKVYIFGKSSAIVSSANLTTSGLDSNIEVGVEVSSEETKALVKWFDQLWKLASPVSVEMVADMQRDTAALRREFQKLKNKVRAKSKPLGSDEKKTNFSDSLQDLFESTKHFFVCNSNRKQGDRTPTGGYVLEEEMHNRGFSVAWEDFDYPKQMASVEPGDTIFMFAKRVGIIGIGVAEGICETLDADAPDRVSKYLDSIEWRIPTRWLAWTDKDGAFDWTSPNLTFGNVSQSKYDKFRREVMAHFLGEE